MPAVSKKQFRFMKAIENGTITKPGLSAQKAAEYTSENHSLKNLPERVGEKKRFQHLSKHMKGNK